MYINIQSYMYTYIHMYILICVCSYVLYIYIYTVYDVKFVKGAVSMETLPEPISGVYLFYTFMKTQYKHMYIIRNTNICVLYIYIYTYIMIYTYILIYSTPRAVC